MTAPQRERLTIQRHDALEARALRDRLFAVYIEVYADKLDDPFYTLDRFAERFEGQSARPGYTLVTGHLPESPPGELIGYAYGLPLAPTTMWWDGVLDPLPPEFLHEDGHRTFAINEIMVRAAWRRRGFARQLHDALLGDRPERRATLLVDPANIPARSAYLSWGWRVLTRLKPFDDAPVYEALMIDLPLKTTTEPPTEPPTG